MVGRFFSHRGFRDYTRLAKNIKNVLEKDSEISDGSKGRGAGNTGVPSLPWSKFFHLYLYAVLVKILQNIRFVHTLP